MCPGTVFYTLYTAGQSKRRCGKCIGCLRKEDCGQCKACK